MLEVPVSLFATDCGSDLVCIGGGSTRIVAPAHPPFSFVESRPGIGTQVRLIGGGESWIIKDEYEVIPTREEGPPGNRQLVPTVDYVLDLLKEHPGDIRALCGAPYEPYPVFLDIETASAEEHFSKSERDEIVCIQLKFPDSPPIILTHSVDIDDSVVASLRTVHPGIIIESGRERDEPSMLRTLLRYLRDGWEGRSPDIVVGYFHGKFDVPYIFGRLRKHQMMTEFREEVRKYDGTLHYSNWLTFGLRRGEEVDIAPGLLNLDLYGSAYNDMAIRTLPRKGLKQVSAFYGAQVVDIPESDKGRMKELLEVDPEYMLRYSLSDVILTEYLWDIYKHGMIAQANMLSCPLTMVQRMSSGQKSYLAFYREVRENGFFSFTRNRTRYREVFEEAKSQKFEGAIVRCFQTGYFPRIIYLDAASMYPNIYKDMNMSPEVYELRSVRTYEESDVREIGLVEENGEKILVVPDNSLELVFRIRVDFENDGFVRRMLDRFNSIRNEYKAKAKEFKKRFEETGDPADRVGYLQYESRQQAAKILNNTMYGLQGASTYEVTDYTVAITITAVGRWIIQQAMDYFGDAVIESDTDGLILDRDRMITEDITVVNGHLRAALHEKFGIPYEKMNFHLEFEGAGSCYMYKKKNYVYLPEGAGPEKITVKGSTLVGYNKAKVLHRAVKILSQSTMRVGEYGGLPYREACDLALDIAGCPAEDFMFTQTVRRDPGDYKGYQSLQCYVIEQARADASISGGTPHVLMKRRALQWLDNNFKNDDRLKQYRSLVHRCTCEEEIGMVIDLLSEVRQERKQSVHFVLDIILRELARGRKIEVDDTLQFYWTKTKEKYSTPSEFTGPGMLDLDAYRKAIGSIIETFKYADPVAADMNLW